MILEAALAYAHLAAILAWVVFLSSATALARTEWLNAAALVRLQRVDRIALVAGVVTLATGLARAVWGIKGLGWYAVQPLLWIKALLWLSMLAFGYGVTRRIASWRRHSEADGQLPSADALASVRRRLMWSTHLMVLPPLLGVMLARGLGVV
jgi:putative membrane protein